MKAFYVILNLHSNENIVGVSCLKYQIVCTGLIIQFRFGDILFLFKSKETSALKILPSQLQALNFLDSKSREAIALNFPRYMKKYM